MSWYWDEIMRVQVDVYCDCVMSDGSSCEATQRKIAMTVDKANRKLEAIGWVFAEGGKNRCPECDQAGRPFGKPEASDE